MNGQVWWFVARASGIVAWVLLTATVLWGILLPAKMFPKQRPAWILDLHRWMAGLTIGFLAVHLGSLVADNYLHFGAAELLVPGQSEYETAGVALGILAMWLLLIVELTSLAKKHLPRRAWHAVHLFSYGAFMLTSLHGVLAGTDAQSPLFLATTIAAVVSVVFATIYRVVTRRDRSQRVRSIDPSAMSRPDPSALTQNRRVVYPVTQQR
ncbi:MAG: ferric reductase-like transmembrane domain-containing protein [Candidatus Microthrix sp.]|jgi:DMSO/TMAO reductase YedYZ heme-binding membrane subunit|uniref:Ferric reductase-like transmembrane domain-containing protein n=1 Tax=Candidatus Neomicrothrix subdominans TaxID=2954438 RepID=A0A936NEN2_9ACTN|nr:ferric reductase-like transmembrane domain-containing protein [Candidatus Microthrix sp.]MBK9298224.1 ferric reductase-like transmembrane domain-containing protein [Candidatus Microthrix subdominans]MBK6309734.1 ferric reductase-like transmembrane domain-containing protein [Candidatus Microthrix sp.]MBK6438953.1 ferric reductase-like transmembrane domain-containing protein [Candidatus Microthrix sp.]MBK7165251.1 ferric reductase-like transmembrane domain-containing protein [Candidatus Microt